MPQKTPLTFCTVCQKLSHSLPEHGAVPGESDNRLIDYFLQKRYILLQNWKACHFWEGYKKCHECGTLQTAGHYPYSTC